MLQKLFARKFVAVISFFIISGYVMTFLIYKYYSDFTDIHAFYLDRAIRLFPQYLLYLILTLLSISLLGLQNNFWQEIDLPKIVLNVLLLPAGFYMFGLENSLYIPPAWTLGLEAAFYLAVPIFLNIQKKYRYFVIFLSIIIFLFAMFGLLNSDWFGYRLLPGTFYIFVIGMTLADPKLITPNFSRLISLFAIGAAFCVLLSPQLYALPYNKEVLFGVTIGTFIVTFLRKTTFSRMDEFLGNLSYGVFLNHWLVMVFLEALQFAKIWVPFVSIILAGLSYYLVERPAARLRRHMRAKRNADLVITK